MVQLDVNNVFLNVDLQEEIFMEIRHCLDIHGEQSSSKMVIKLNKSIYGLKQVSKQWFKLFSRFMIALGYIQSKSYYSFLIKAMGTNM